MTPVLEELTSRPAHRLQVTNVVGAKPAERPHELGAFHDPDGVELDRADLVNQTPQLAPSDPGCGSGPAKPLGVDRQPARLAGRQRRCRAHATILVDRLMTLSGEAAAIAVATAIQN